MGLSRFAAGAVAGGAGLAVTFLLRIAGLGVFLPEVAVDLVVELIPGSLESFLIQTMGEGAKLLGLTVALLVFLAVPGLYALFYRWVEGLLKRRWAVTILYWQGATAGALFVILPLLGEGLAGSLTPEGPGLVAFSQLLGWGTFAIVLDYLMVDVSRRYPEGFSLSRRQFLAVAAGTVLTFALAIYGIGSFLAREIRTSFLSIADLFAKEVTPNSEFYVVSKNVVDPVVNVSTWDLTVDGLVSDPLTYRYEELQARMKAREYVTLECVSNQVGGNLISTAEWEGIPLAELIKDSGPEDQADWVVFTCADGYTVAIPREKAEDPSALMALRMNGVPLPFNHGYPARIVVPGIYGMFSAKWLTRITLVEGEFLGFWQQKGWTNRGAITTTAIIAVPRSGALVEGTVPVGGVAFSGDRGISKVEVSFDDGETWEEAELKSPPLSSLTWVLWSLDWVPPGPGTYRILARTTDGDSVPQDPARESPYPRGASGYDSIELTVRGL